ncbi:HlyD family efflux transporter periplasmic adaptor subunit [Nocardioides sp. NPDC047086]|uniref:HlyD family efflux transporter periplasmic adaptor subunit n=1 Tax=Nocardioides sp. NPDC047086 TaxID=3154810 RepID=UPI0033FBB255
MRRPAARWVRATSGVATLAVLAGCGYVAYAASTDPADGYRLASASTGDVEQTLSLAGTVAPNGRADLSFGTSGTVASVVEEGTTVKEGQVLARLDTSSLKKSLKTAKASLASAKAQLESDKEAQASGSTSSSSSTATESSTTTSDTSGGVITAVFTGSSGTSGTMTAVGDTDVVAQIKALQTEVTDAQTAVSTAEGELEDAQADLSAAIDKLSELVSGGGTLDDGGALAQALDDAKASCTSTDEGSSEKCTSNLNDALAAQGSAKGSVQDAIGQLNSAQEAVGRAKEALSGAKGTLATTIDDLDALLASASAGGTGGGTGGTPEGGQGDTAGGSPGGSGGEKPGGVEGSVEGQSGAGTQPEGMTGQGSAESGSGGAMGGSGQSVTAATIAQDQAEIDRAEVDIIDAKAALAAAVVKAPADGTVAAVDVTDGSSVSAGAAAVTVIAEGLTSVELEVTSAQLGKLQVGQTAAVSPAGVDKDLSGKVTLLGKVPDTSSGSSTFSVTVTLDEEGLDLLAGNTATVEVVLGSAEDVLTVPASAVSNGSVTVLDKDGNPQKVRVTTGLTGRTTVEVTEGIDEGDEIVLADLSTALPTTDDSSSDGGGGAFSTGGGSSVFPGGAGGAGFPGGGPPSR